jgi:two-component system, chemotaxis family, CheB/CheR fusion protein
MAKKKSSQNRKEQKSEPRERPQDISPSEEDTASAQGEETDAPIRDSISFPIVGMGASAGGLEAFEIFFRHMPSDSGMAFVLVAHLDPTHVSILPELIQKHTKMSVLAVEDGVQVRPNTVHVIPPQKELNILNGVLYLLDQPQPRGANLPIDTFFRSLAQDQGNNAICIILSGTGSDGTLGLKAIKGELGMAMVQEEETAKYDGMPRNAIATRLADYILPVDKMPEELIKYVDHKASNVIAEIPVVEKELTNVLPKIFLLLRTQTGHDFSQYKRNTIYRRVERRMHVHQIDDISHYARYLRESKGEVEILFKELLIGVTNFFRDPQAFEMLKDLILSLFEDKPDEYTFRVWVPGCSTGEEAFSIAMLLQECMEERQRHFSIQIFATDLDEETIAMARLGRFPTSIAADVTPERLQRFFTSVEEAYEVKKSIRDMLVFAPQDLIKDPPFTKLDLLCCRNLLIYLNPELQQKILPIFHYSLKPDAILFLGSSESVGSTTDLFRLVDKKWKIYVRQPSSSVAHPILSFPTPPDSEQEDQPEISETLRRAEELSAFQMVETILQQTQAPPCAIIDAASNLVYTHGRTGRYLEPVVGRVSVNILDMARPGLKAELAAAIRQAATHRQEVIHKGLRVEENGGHLFLDLTVKPILEQSSLHGFLMVVFEETAIPTREEPGEPELVEGEQKSSDVDRLERELQYTRENLQTSIEELETSNEELKSTNEELQSTNEELQSTNEELETSKEELQSLNEESVTVNAELQSRIEELSATNDDIKNLFDSTAIATLFLDMELQIRRFTPQMKDIIPLSDIDIGRPIQHLASNLLNGDLSEYAAETLRTLERADLERSTRDGQRYRMQILPYRTATNVIDGVVITFVDITEQKKIEESLRESEDEHRVLAEKLQKSEERFQIVLSNSPLIIAHIDRDLRYTWIYNPHPDFDPASLLGKRDDELVVDEGTQQLVQLKQQVIETGARVQAEITFSLSGGGRTYEVVAEPLKDAAGAVIGATTVAFDITQRNRMEIELQEMHDALEQRMGEVTFELEQETVDRQQAESGLVQQREFLEQVVEAATEGITVSDEEGHYILYNRRMFEITGYTREEAERADFPTLLYPDPIYREKAAAAIAGALSGEDAINQQWEMACKGGRQRTVLISTRLIEHGKKKWLLGMVRDITDLRS